VAVLAADALQALESLTLEGAAAGSAVPSPQLVGLVEALSGREQEILGHIAAGRSNLEIAELLICSTGTVKWYTSQIYGKLGVKSRTQAIARARELGLIG
jgi:LuxR family maltose regulon positive regulatory protein